MTLAAVVTAAGSGTRLGRGLPKALIPVRGTPMVTWAASAMAVAATRIVVTAPASHLDQFRAALAQVAADVAVIPGGEDRQSSVAAGVAHLVGSVPGSAPGSAPAPEVIVVHDAARPFAPAAVLGRALEALDGGQDGQHWDGVIPVIPVVDTMVALHEGVAYLDRAALGAVQTPQVFRAAALSDAHARAARDGVSATDDGSLLVHYGYRVTTCEGSLEARKITYPEDLDLSERRLA